MSKRRAEGSPPPDVRAPKKNSLDSDEEDEEEKENEVIPDQRRHLDGGEEATIDREGDVKITPFNMKEELEEGHFDAQGHFQWKKEKEIADSWLDNIDWMKIEGKPGDKYKLGNDSESESDDEDEKPFDLIAAYKEMLSFMRERETVLKTLQRLGPKTNISSAERWKRKKAGIVDAVSEEVTKLTSIANEVLTKTGNMDVYQQTYEGIKSIVEKAEKKAAGKDCELDMYADDFDAKEKEKKEKQAKKTEENEAEEEDEPARLMWEFKWNQSDDAEVHGPHSTDQMHQWVQEGYFKTGVWVRKCGIDSPFYASNRIDFDLYL